MLATLLVFYPGSATSRYGMPEGVPSRQAWDHSHAVAPGEAHVAHLAAALARERASADVRYVAGWIATTGDNDALPYIVIDKLDARAFVFDAAGRLQGSAAVLLGMTPGDASAEGVGSRALSAIAPDERTTPAGRFIASLGKDLQGQDILWVDYDSGLALHRVVKGTPGERRAQRLESPTPLDNRVSYGCINVPVAFFETFVGPAFSESSGVVYILPELSPPHEMFRNGLARPRVDSPGGP